MAQFNRFGPYVELKALVIFAKREQKYNPWGLAGDACGVCGWVGWYVGDLLDAHRIFKCGLGEFICLQMFAFSFKTRFVTIDPKILF